MTRTTNTSQSPDIEYLKIAEYAEILRVDHKTIRAAIKAGQIPVVRLGRAIRIPRRVLQSLETQACVATPEGKS